MEQKGRQDWNSIPVTITWPRIVGMPVLCGLLHRATLPVSSPRQCVCVQRRRDVLVVATPSAAAHSTAVPCSGKQIYHTDAVTQYCMYTFPHPHTHASTCTHAHMHLCAHTKTQAHKRIHKRTHTHPHTPTLIVTFTHHTHVHTCMCVMSRRRFHPRNSA